MSTSSLSKQRFTLVDFQMYCTCIANFNIKSNEIITLHIKYKIYEVDFSISMAKRDLLIRDSSDENVPLLFGCFLNWKKETTSGNIQIKKHQLYWHEKYRILNSSPAELDVRSMFVWDFSYFHTRSVGL